MSARSLKLRFVQPFLKLIASALSRSRGVYRLSQLIIATHDNDANADMHANGEAHVLAAVLSGIARPTVFDVGANIGDYSALALSLMKADLAARVFAFEPASHNIEALNRRFEGQAQLRIVPLALSSVAGEQNFYVSTDPAHRGHDSLFDMKTIGYDDRTVTTRVTCTTLDAFCESEQIASIDFLKMDVEGHEYNVLLGAKGMLQRGSIPRIQFEFGHAARAGRVMLLDFVTLLNEYGYDLFIIHPAGLRALTYTPWEENRYNLINILAAKRDVRPSLEKIVLAPR